MGSDAIDKPLFVGELLKSDGNLRARDLFAPESKPARLAGGQPKSARQAKAGSIVHVGRDDDGWRIKEVLAGKGSALEKMYRIASEHGLDPVFPPAVDREVAALTAAPNIDDPTLEDLTALPFVTIDGPGTRDLDQAVFIERRGGDLLVYYALADPAWCVRPGTALFTEALRRGATYYLPGLAIPMLPRALSEGIVSLNEKVERRAAVFKMRVAPNGRCSETTIARARMRSRAQLTFEQVQRYLDDPSRHPLPDPEAGPSMNLLREVGELRMQDAERRDVVSYRRSETEVKLAAAPGMRFVVGLGMRSLVERYNEQLSLMCNVQGARFLRAGDEQDDHVQPIYRVHPSPGKHRYQELEALLAAMAERHDLNRELWTWQRRGGRSLADFLAALPQDGAHDRISKAVHRQAVITNLRSTFSEQPGRHYGVGADVYARFSAPMREIVGVFLHKEAFEKLAGSEPSRSNGVPDDDALREQIVTIANEAKLTQKQLTRAANRAALDQLFEEDRSLPRNERPARRGTVMGLNRGKAHVLLDDPAIEVKIYARHLEKLLGTELELTDDGVQVQDAGGKVLCRIGDAVMVRVHDRDRGGDRWMLSLERDAG